MLSPLPDPPEELPPLLDTASAGPDDDVLHEYIDLFYRKYDSNINALILYGSYLSPALRKPTSFPDFILIGRDKRSVNLTFGQRCLYSFLPPHALSETISKRAGGPSRCKYYILTRDDFERATSTSPPDLAIAGRLGKRVAILRADAAYRSNLVQAWARSMALNGILALSDLPEIFDLDVFILGALRASYRAEFRMVEKGKIEGLLAAERDFYARAYGTILRHLERCGWVAGVGSSYRVAADPTDLHSLADPLIARSRRNGKWRLVKYILLFKNWTEYLVDKIERSQGERIHLTPLERRLPLIFAWRHFFRLLREDRLR
ncbi:MAG: hypothetical protein HYY13_04760 [Nitrospirae bacterium]|nr:hypothetical protein [Nitrospirota bacterium]